MMRTLTKKSFETFPCFVESFIWFLQESSDFILENGNSKKRVTKGKDGVYSDNFPPTTQAEQVADEKERKARTLLLMAVPKSSQTFSWQWMMKEICASYQTRECKCFKVKRKMEAGRKQVEVKISSSENEKESFVDIDEVKSLE
ncbi:hypothetical protein Tco_0231053 [Tanacetum coccineum]